MSSFFNLTAQHITQLPSSIYGLSYRPTLEPVINDNQDSPAFGWPSGPEVSLCNLAVVSDVVARVGTDCTAILEIGVHRNSENSISSILIDNKPQSAVYLGVDIEDKRYIDDHLRNVYTIKANSHDQPGIRHRLRSIGVSKLDIIMIDGWHSVNTCINDWLYTDMLSDTGAVILHDTNAHPGSIALFEAVDINLFHKTRYCQTDDDMGIAVFWHKKIS
jgi:hypothetical protein